MHNISRQGESGCKYIIETAESSRIRPGFWGLSVRWIGRDIIIIMDMEKLTTALSGLALGPLRFFEQVDSTNSEAARWADSGAPDLALVVADEQTAGRGRQGRKWFTPAEAALAFSLVLRQAPGAAASEDQTFDSALLMRLTALGALAVCQVLQEKYALPAEIKWPNDVLVKRRKLAGILAEVYWQGDQLQAVILGIGINIAPDSVPIEAQLSYPATCIQTELGRPVERLEVLKAVLENVLKWRTRLHEPDFLSAWDQHLAFKGEWVTIFENDSAGTISRQGCVLGLDEQGQLRLIDRAGEEFRLLTGELRLRPATS
jgi:BirA family biotin operon repressor/biotin-[acetyl-CoA-carboxylase] ligase